VLPLEDARHDELAEGHQRHDEDREDDAHDLQVQSDSSSPGGTFSGIGLTADCECICKIVLQGVGFRERTPALVMPYTAPRPTSCSSVKAKMMRKGTVSTYGAWPCSSNLEQFDFVMSIVCFDGQILLRWHRHVTLQS
jgi:hypothetical protein